ncbi:DUF3347 domain-containing protein [Galbibacter pacificus]|uniref:DUF3347 domain-containing protein n=1 Tax=Galbibacter pacificus TaxID=2996052 RepID=A0ABT6FR37_9FLAO|nr:DUF3347 domain-containing protein [Galbibacter pacificus]MDG3581794.1 DUF3347 domain-containing protein [Galbibacter pacificus]MDG3585732.1 DUF3347 domain-containing protein [Galbibacter pacificus]
MKKASFKLSIIAIALIGFIAVGCKNQNNESAANGKALAFKNDLTEKAFLHYQEIKTALTKGNVDAAKIGGKKLSETISNNYMDVSNLSKEIATEDDIEKQKVSFSKLTEAIQPIFESNISEGALYKQFCPMALNNEGGYWFSTSETIENPYFEGKMDTCGSVKEVLK